MSATPGPRTVRLHLVLLSTVALPALLILVVVGVAVVIASGHSRDDALFALLVTAPLWLVGLLATGLILTILRGRHPRLVEVAIVSLAAVIGGAGLFAAQGSLDLVAALLLRPQDVGLEWPSLVLWDADHSGAVYNRLDAGGLWLSLLWLVLGVVGVAWAFRDWRHSADDARRSGRCWR